MKKNEERGDNNDDNKDKPMVNGNKKIHPSQNAILAIHNHRRLPQPGSNQTCPTEKGNQA